MARLVRVIGVEIAPNGHTGGTSVAVSPAPGNSGAAPGRNR